MAVLSYAHVPQTLSSFVPLTTVAVHACACVTCMTCTGEAVAKKRRLPSSKGFDFFVESSYVEVYNETCRDLYSRSGPAGAPNLPVSVRVLCAAPHQGVVGGALCLQEGRVRSFRSALFDKGARSMQRSPTTFTLNGQVVLGLQLPIAVVTGG